MRTTDFKEDSVVSEPPSKELHELEQSIAEANQVITKLTLRGDVILNCFMRIMTTGIAAINNHRRFIGIEKDLVILEIARRRIDTSSITIKGESVNSCITTPSNDSDSDTHHHHHHRLEE